MPRHRATLVALLVLAVLAACSGEDEGSTTTTGAAAGGDERPLLPIADAAARQDVTPLRVQGVLFVTADETRLCGAIGESYPVQCLGDSLVVTGVDPDDHRLVDGGPGVEISEGTVIVPGVVRGGVLVAD